jgi:hypothetical protein
MQDRVLGQSVVEFGRTPASPTVERHQWKLKLPSCQSFTSLKGTGKFVSKIVKTWFLSVDSWCLFKKKIMVGRVLRGLLWTIFSTSYLKGLIIFTESVRDALSGALMQLRISWASKQTKTGLTGVYFLRNAV